MLEATEPKFWPTVTGNIPCVKTIHRGISTCASFMDSTISPSKYVNLMQEVELTLAMWAAAKTIFQHSWKCKHLCHTFLGFSAEGRSKCLLQFTPGFFTCLCQCTTLSLFVQFPKPELFPVQITTFTASKSHHGPASKSMNNDCVLTAEHQSKIPLQSPEQLNSHHFSLFHCFTLWTAVPA